MRSLSIRVRLTLWYGCVLALTLVGCGIAVYLILSFTLMREIDGRLDGVYDAIEDRLEDGGDLSEVVERQEDHHRPYLVRLSRSDGSFLFEDAPLRSLTLALPSETAETRRPVYHAVSLGELGPHRFLSGTVRGKEESWVLHVGLSLAEYHHELAELGIVLLTILPMGLLAALVGGYLLAGRALAPVHRITAAARSISAKDLSHRVEVPNPHDELGQLANTINQMIARLEHAFDAMRQFTADASHELLTPLTAVRTEVEVALRSDRSPEQYRRVLASVLEEVERMTRLADSLLLLSREDAGIVQRSDELVRLDQVVREVAGHMEALASESGIRLTVGTIPLAVVRGEAGSLHQVFFNLLDNAIKYTPQGGEVIVNGRRTEREVSVEITDTGIGIRPESLPRIFDRFYRVDKSRSRELGGTGLGLSISKALIERHGGRMEVESLLERGSTFRVVLPIADGPEVMDGQT